MTSGLLRDLRVAVRRLVATPLFLLFAVVSLAVGLSVTITAYALIDSTIWRHTGMRDPAQVAILTVPVVGPRGPTPERTWARVLSPTDIDDLTASQRTFASMAVLTGLSTVLTIESVSTPVRSEAVSGRYFEVAGVRPLLGRVIGPDDDRGVHQVIVLSESLWRRHFAERQDIVGRTVRFDGRAFDVIGVVPATFRGSAIGEVVPLDAWIPLSATTVPLAGSSADERALSVIGRLSSMTSMEAASADVRAIGQRLDTVRPRRGRVGDQDAALRARAWAVGGIEAQDPLAVRIGWFLVLLVAVVLVVACTNLANLMLARGMLRQQELAIRRALGGTRTRLVREFVVEAVLIASLGAFAALLLTRGLFLIIPQEIPSNSGSIPITPVFSARLLIGAAGALLLSLIGFGLEPALQLTRPSVVTDLTTTGTTAGLPRSRRPRALIAVQVALCTGFFAVTAVAARVALDETRHDSGVDLEHLAIGAIAQQPGWDDARLRRVADEAAQAVRGGAGVERVAVTSGVPFGTPGLFARVTTPGRPFDQPSANAENGALVMGTTPGALDVLGIPRVAGRALDASDEAEARPVAMINASTAKRLFGTRDAVGREIVVQQIYGRQRDTRTLTVVGIVRDTDTLDVYLRQLGAIYVPLSQVPVTPNVFLIARGQNPAAVAPLLQASVRQANPDAALWFVGPGSLLMAAQYVAARIAAVLAIALGGIALFLALVGLFGLQSQVASRRTRETGIRMALGATVREIRRWMVRDGMQPVMVGVGAGLVLSVMVRLLLRATLPVAIPAVDPLVLLVVPIPLAVAAYIACRIPASRAARIDPNTALRHL